MSARCLMVVALAIQGFQTPAEGAASLLARPPIAQRTATGFVASEKSHTPITKNNGISSTAPSGHVSVGIRSSCARERAVTTVRIEGEATASAAARLRGGSYGPGHPPPPFTPHHLHGAENMPKERPSTDTLDNCKKRNRHGSNAAMYAASTHRVFEENTSPTKDPFEDQDQDGATGGGNLGRGESGSGGGGGGGPRAGAMPSFPRTLPAVNGKAPFSKKFAWVP